MRLKPTKVAVFGSGSFGTAMGTHLALQGHEVWIVTRRQEVVDKIAREHRHPNTFPEFALPYNLTATTEAADALRGADYILHAIPVQSSYEFYCEMRELIPPTVPIINTSKGLHTQRLELMNDLICAALERPQPIAILSGPTFAKELMQGFPTGAVIASSDQALATAVAKLFTSHTFRAFTSLDVVGVELAGALKNVYGLAAGAVEGLGLGVNTTALLVTRAVAEMNKLARVLGASEATLNGLSGVGDLMLTCFGKESRNRTVGVRLGRGETLADIMASMTEVAEGVATAPAALALARRHNIHVPIIESVCAVLAPEPGALALNPMTALMMLLLMPVGEETVP